jgi:DNA-binding XRE family transcriptional regulator
MTVGDRIKEQRELSRMSQVELAEKIHVSKQTL